MQRSIVMEKNSSFRGGFRKQSIKSKSLFLFVPVIALPIILGIILIMCFGKYFRRMDYSNNVTYNILKVDNHLDNIYDSLNNYFENGKSTDKEAILVYLDETDEAINEMYSKASRYKDPLYDDMQAMNNVYDEYASSIAQILKEDDYRASRTRYHELHLTSSEQTISKYLLSIENDEWEYSKDTYDATRFDTNVLKVVFVSIYLVIILVTVLTVLYIKKHICDFINDISDQTRLLNQGYYDMQDIYCEADDEMSKLAFVFNSVKKQLKEVKRIDFENQEILRKLKAEEINKEHFVKKLYVEKKEKENITEKAQKDGLTGLYNRRTFENLVDQYLTRKPEGKFGALFIMDMDYFKSVNDTLGHLGGDEALKYMAGALRMVFTGNSYIGRWGGDEFTAFMTDINGVEDVKKAAEDLCSRMNITLEYNEIKKDISVSVGAAMTPGVNSMSELYLRADKALYHVKNNGRNNYSVYAELSDDEKEL